MTGTRKTILLVEDDALIAAAETRLLSGSGFDVVSARSGERALEMFVARERGIDLVLMDVDLGKGMDGPATASEILKLVDVPVVFISSHTEQDVVERTRVVASYGFVAKSAGDAVLLASLDTAFKLHGARRGQTLPADTVSDASYRELLNAVDDAIYILDEQGVFSDVNDGAVKMYGHPREMFIGKTPAFLSAPGRNDLEAAGRAIMTAYHGHPQRLDWWGLRANGEIFPKDVRMNRGTYLGKDVVIAVGRDMSDRRRVEEKLAESDRQYRTLVEGMNEGLLQVDNDDVIIYANRQFCDLTGYTREELIGKVGFDLLFRKEDRDVIRRKNSVRKRGLSDAYQLPVLRKDGRMLWVRISGSPVYDATGNVVGSIGIHTDMTQQKKSDEELQRAVRDREVLMKELQHRVKNNLVIISSLLGFEVPRLRDEYSRQILLDAQTRIRSMSIIYEQLQYAEKTGSVRLDRYIDDLGRALIGTYEMERGRVRIVAHVDPIELDQKRTIPVGLILNELITNALKYAYPAGKEGEILVRLVARDGNVVFSVSDTGVGLPGGLDPATSESMGMSLIRLLAEQLDGRVDFQSGAGMNITVTFPVTAS